MCPRTFSAVFFSTFVFNQKKKSREWRENFHNASESFALSTPIYSSVALHSRKVKVVFNYLVCDNSCSLVSAISSNCETGRRSRDQRWRPLEFAVDLMRFDKVEMCLRRDQVSLFGGSEFERRVSDYNEQLRDHKSEEEEEEEKADHVN